MTEMHMGLGVRERLAGRLGLDGQHLPSRRSWRGSPVKVAPRKATAHSKAGSGPMTRAPSVRTFMSSCSTPWCAEYVSWQTAAPDAAHLVGRHGRADPRSADEDPAIGVARVDRLAEPPREVRVVVVRVGAVAAEVDQVVAEAGRGRGGRAARP